MIHLMGRSMLLAVSAYMLTACTTGTNLYYWGNYEQALYSYTKRPGEVDQYIESLGEIVAEGEKRNKVPPGLYAEYGYALMTAGREAEALEYFEKERTNAHGPDDRRQWIQRRQRQRRRYRGDCKRMNVKPLLALAAISSVLVGCATVNEPKDYSAFREEDPVSILIVPPINNAVDVDAAAFYLSTISRPVGERGYYVFPVHMVKTLLEQDGMSDANLLHSADPELVADLFGADAILYVTIQRWDAQYVVFSTQVTVQFDYELRSGKTGETLWTQSATRVFSSDSGNSQGGLAGLLADAIVAAVEKASPNYVPLAKQANAAATATPQQGVPAGKYHPKYGQDGALFGQPPDAPSASTAPQSN